MSKIYRQFAENRRVFQAECNIVSFLLKLNHLNADSKILDAACGTGDVIALVKSEGHKNVYAVDGSQSMAALWKNTLNGIQAKQCAWQNLKTVFNEWGTFDLVYFLGHSLPHLSIEALPALFGTLYDGLNKGGVVAFDIRPWVKNNDKSLTQAGRGDRVQRYLHDVNIESESYMLFDEVTYKDSVQFVKYTLLPNSSDGKLVEEVLSYQMYDWEYAHSLLKNAGFTEESLGVFEFPGWPYVVVTAKKSK